MATGKMNEPDFKQQIRLPLELANWLKARADENSRSFTGEVAARLKASRKREEQQEDTDAKT